MNISLVKTCITFGYALVILTLSACLDPDEVPVKGIPQTLSLHKFISSQPFDISGHIFDVKYILLETTENPKMEVSKITFNQTNVFILDKTVSQLYIYNLKGKLIHRIKRVQAFYLTDDLLYTYEMPGGLMITRTFNGKAISKNNIGFRGVDFVKLNDSTFVFQTAGLTTLDAKSSEFELAYIDNNGKLLAMAIPIALDKQGINYTAKDRFSTDRDKVFFTPALENIVYHLERDTIRPLLKFDFGELNLTDSVFKSFSDVEDYNIAPYIINITQKFTTPRSAFFTCTLKGMEGYFTVQKNNHKIIEMGRSAVAGESTAFNNNIPEAFFMGRYLSVIEPEEFITNFRRLLPKDSLPAHLSPLGYHTVAAIKNPVLMLYRLKETN